MYDTVEISKSVEHLLSKHRNVLSPCRHESIHESITTSAAVQTNTNALSTWTPAHSTGRSPKNTFIVAHKESKDTIDWHSSSNHSIDPEAFDAFFDYTCDTLQQKEKLYISTRAIGADKEFALPVKTVADNPLTILFTHNMFRDLPNQISDSIFHKTPFTLLVLPDTGIPDDIYMRCFKQKKKASMHNMVIAMDMERMTGLIIGSSYLGTVKKLMFTVMNYLLPEHGILPLHCSANEGEAGDSALLLGLSGTGKTTLSFDPHRTLIGDDEHAWSDNGISNFENGCYAKLIDLDREKEPDIYHAVFDERPLEENGVIIENTMLYPNGSYDLSDCRLTPNSRSSFPMFNLKNTKESAVGNHPKTILFLTADANGVLPPVAKLNNAQAMLWFLMGYTSKLAGTETGIVEPRTTFSRFFGEPFMPRNPADYIELFGKKIQQHGANVYLVNTGWTGGPYGEGKRIDITVTRAIVDACMNGDIEKSGFTENHQFHILVPKSCPGVEDDILAPINTWNNKKAYNLRAHDLATEFSRHFDIAYSNANISAEIKTQCPGK